MMLATVKEHSKTPVRVKIGFTLAEWTLLANLVECLIGERTSSEVDAPVFATNDNGKADSGYERMQVWYRVLQERLQNARAQCEDFLVRRALRQEERASRQRKRHEKDLTAMANEQERL